MLKKYGYDILVVPSNSLDVFKDTFSDCIFPDTYSKEDCTRWMLRDEAETDTSFKQVIPYITITAKNKVALFRRYVSGESRLEGKYTLGIGGHIERCDALLDGEETEVDEIVAASILREINEEIVVDKELQQNIGYLDFNSFVSYIELYNSEVNNKNGVNYVHLGLPYTLLLNKKLKIKPKGDELLFKGWFTLEEILQEDIKDNLEDWSLYVAETMLSQKSHENCD